MRDIETLTRWLRSEAPAALWADQIGGGEYAVVADAIEEGIPWGAGRWEHCSPALLAGGLRCGMMLRRACACPASGGHDHWIAEVPEDVEIVHRTPTDPGARLAEHYLKEARKEDRDQLVEALGAHPGTHWGEAIEKVERLRDFARTTSIEVKRSLAINAECSDLVAALVAQEAAARRAKP